MQAFQPFDATLLDSAGLNRQAVFDIDALPSDLAAAVRAACVDAAAGRQLILIGHAGRRLWQSIEAAGIDGAHPVDAWSVRTVQQWFARCQPHTRYEIIYPSEHPIGLQRLGALAGWHHATPFMVGIDQRWGSWYAYRALLVADTAFEPTRPLQQAHPCDACAQQACVGACPGGALDGGRFDFARCVGHRKLAGSACKASCPARLACPVGAEHRYDDAQIAHIYALSMQAIEQYY
jgi:epoxyqueuosine reductase